MMPGLRGYSAAENVARYGDFKSSRGSADYELREGLAEVRAKVRFLARNSGSMRRYMQLMAVNIVGESGFRLQSRVRQAGGSAATSLNKRVQDAFMAWSEAPTTCGQLHMIELESQAVKTFARDGEVIWEFVTGPQYVDGIAINPLEADMLDETLNTTHPPTKNEIRMGVEVDSYGRPVAYHFLTTHPGDLTWYSYQSNRRYRRVPADRVIHLFEKSRPGQTRGEPPAASMVLNVKMLDGYREAETMSRRLRAALMGFFENQMPETRGISELADDDDDTEKPDDEPFEMQMEPGRLKQLPRGVTFKEFSPGGSQTDYADYESQVKKDIAMGLGISTMSHGMEVSGVSYSSGRTVITEDRDFYKSMQGFFIRGLMRRTFRKWIEAHVVYADMPALLPSQVGRVLGSYVFRARGWDWVDPTKDVTANIDALRTKQTSLARVAAQRGIDRDELLMEIKEDAEAAEALGLTLTYDGDTTQASDREQPNDNSDS